MAAKPTLGVSPAPGGVLQFPNTRTGRSRSLAIRITNLTPAPGCALHGTVSAPGAPFTGGGTFFSNGNTDLVFITFSHTSRGTFTRTVTITSNDPANPSVTITVRGRGVNFFGF